MNCYLFIDNFRGFSNARIPITNVNFLVGQNSTGKTSVLGLLKLFSGPRFLYEQVFGDEQVTFGHFSDMVSAHSDDKSFFRAGLVWEEPTATVKRNQKLATGWLGTFLEEEGLPRLSKYTFCRGSEVVSLRLNGNDIYYKAQTHPGPQTVQGILTDLLPQWIDEHSGKMAGGYKRLSMPKAFRSKVPIMVALSLIGGVHEPISRKRVYQFSPANVAVLPEVTWIAPIRTKPRRTYDELSLAFSPEGGHIPYLIRAMLRSNKSRAEFRAFIERVGEASGLFQDIRIKDFGKGTASPFEVDVVLDGKALNVSTVGYGVSQSLPVLVELFRGGHGSWFAIQQPEVHLHPRAQAALGDVFFEMAAAEHKLFLVETHSDFTIDRFRMNYRNGRPDKPDSQILFFERQDKHNVVTPLSIGKSGDLPAEQPEGYRQFFIREELRLLGI
ncbi:MAG TPA: AAA family ATPase [Nitrososphaera sp.]|nr:AAA family ATPase [Nitrososphaera sp.]